jgi:FixJ family two-component response regulator
VDAFLVAVVEDDVSMLESLQGLLESTGYEVLLYSSAEDFLNSDRLQDISCLISDVGLPGMDGIELLRAVQLKRAGLPVIIITSRNEPNLLETALKSGARRAFRKPIDTAALLESIASVR